MAELSTINLLIGMGVPSAFTGFCFWLVEHKMKKREDERKLREEELRNQQEEREENRERVEFFIIQCVDASITLGEATAKALQRIPDAHCNGDMHEALAHAEKIQRQKKEFLDKQAIHTLFGEE